MLATIQAILEPRMMVTILIGISVFASVITLAMPLMTSDKLRSRLKYVSTERDVLRARHREMLEKERSQAKLRSSPKSYMQNLVKQLNLSRLLETQARQ